MMKKILSIVVMLLAFAVSVSAANFAIKDIKVNDIPASGNSLYVELGETLTIDVTVTGATSSNHDVRLRAWIGGYEYDLLEDATEMFAVRDGVTYKKTLQIELPNDLETSGHTYTLNVELLDANNVVRKAYNLYVSELRHNIAVQDVILQPQVLEAGKAAFVKVRLENMGVKKEEDIRVEVSIPELGVSERTYVDELMPYNSDDNSDSTETLYLRLPEDAATGDYEMFVSVSYNRGHSAIQGKKVVHVEGKAQNVAEESKSLVVIETGSEGITVGEQKAYSVMIVNLGKEAKTYTVEVSGVSSWGTASVSPALLHLSAGASGEVVIAVDANEAGNHQMTVAVNEDGELLKQAAVVVSAAKAPSSVKWVVLALVLVLLVVVGAVAVKLLKGSKDENVSFPA
ncbi:hypothetical protein HY501_00995, partial [Candidatus Woesearchaeota archaeon]|nr:hypothetical protein [Candidatus Woesearchaeota archaeon]